MVILWGPMGQSQPLLLRSISHSEQEKKRPEIIQFILQEISEAPSSLCGLREFLKVRERELVLGSSPSTAEHSPLLPDLISCHAVLTLREDHVKMTNQTFVVNFNTIQDVL